MMHTFLEVTRLFRVADHSLATREGAQPLVERRGLI